MLDSTGTTSYAYDAANHVTSITAPVTGTVGYAYDALGRRSSLTYPSGHQVGYAYTARGQLDTVSDWLSGVTDYAYDAAGRLTGITSPNGVVGTLGYNNANRLTSIAYVSGGTTLESIGYTLNAVGIRTAMSDLSGTTSWGYDALDRLTSAAYPNGDAVSYGYDAVGNRTSLTVNGVVTTNVFDAADRMTAAGSDTYTYDANGNETSKTIGGVTTTYAYDVLNRLTGIGGPTTASYVYDGANRRVAKTVNSVTTNYTWDRGGVGKVIAGGDEYVWGGDLLSQVTVGGSATYAHQDGLGSVRLLSDGSGSTTGARAYGAFGDTRSQSGIQSAFTYTDEQVDDESGLVYLRARYMDPDTGRFLSKDPFVGITEQPMTRHRYTYAANNPMIFTDPTGRYWGEHIVNTAADIVEDAGDGAVHGAGTLIDITLNQAIDNPALNPLWFTGMDGWCASGSYGGVGSASASLCLVRTENGDWSVAGSVGGGGGVSFPGGAAAGLGPVWTNASAPCELAGSSGAVNAAGGGEIAGGVNTNFWADSGGDRNYFINPWIGVGAGFQIGGGAEYTWVWP